MNGTAAGWLRLQGHCRMERNEPRLLSNAAGMAIFTIGGMMAGLGVGVIRSWFATQDPFVQLAQVVSGGVTGMVIGLGLGILLAARQRGTFRSLKATMAFIAVTAIVAWAIVMLLRGVIG